MTQPLRSRVAAEVRAEIARQGITYATISDASDISRSSLSRKLAGASEFTLGELVRIAAALNVQASELIARAEMESAAA